MAESSASLAQRVEALEQLSHARVIERVGQIEQRVSRIESAREAEEPHVATKADIARLETLIVETARDTHLKRKPYQANTDLDQLFALAWMVTIAIALVAFMLAVASIIVELS